MLTKVPSVMPLALRPPLRLAWSYYQGFRDMPPLASQSRTFFASKGSCCLALRTSTGEVCWEYRQSGAETGPSFLTGEQVAVYVRGRGLDRLDLLDATSGKKIRSLPRSPSTFAVVRAGLLVNGFADELECWSLKDGAIRWHLALGEETMMNPPCVTDELTVFGQKGGAIRCVDAKTGEPVWETSVADLWRLGGNLKDRIPGEVHGPIQRFGRVLTFPTVTHIVGMSLDTGERLWAVKAVPLAGGGRCGDRLYVSFCAWIDPQSGTYHGDPAGRLVGDNKFERPREWKSKRDTFSGDFLVSSTHIFGTNTAAMIDAWDRETGKHVWHAEPEGGKGFAYLSPLSAAFGRLYYVDGSFRTYCYEEVNPSDPELVYQRGRESFESATVVKIPSKAKGTKDESGRSAVTTIKPPGRAAIAKKSSTKAKGKSR